MEIKHELISIIQNEVSTCKTTQELYEIEKFWLKYFAQLNKFLAGKRDVPYVEDGKIV